jgi:hypothetical protein
VFLITVLKKIFGTKRDDVTGGRRKSHNEGFYNLYLSSDVIRIIILSRKMWAGHVAHMKT